ncbi:MAG: type III-A CRISPR-associated protein Cas10/Csm1 [Saprospiraceae bacterium]
MNQESMLSYHTKLAYGIRKYFPTFSGLEKWGGSTFSEVQWQVAAQLNFGQTLGKEQFVPLRLVFQFLKEGATEGGMVFPYAPLSIDEANFFPSENAAGDFADLEKGFFDEWEKVKTYTPEAAGDTLLFLAKKYLSKVGCSPDMPHVSAFEHIKTTAALAECLERGSDKLLLVAVGLDNIQGFCYDIVSSKAAKSLKGRSFYLQMLLDTIAQDILRHPAINAELGHIIYARGGKMFLLLPDTQSVRGALEETHYQMTTAFWKKFKSSLYCYLQFRPFSATETDIAAVWKDLKEEIRKDRNRKYQQLLVNNFGDFFEPIKEGFDTADRETKKEAAQREAKRIPKGSFKKQFCRVTSELIDNAKHRENNLEENWAEAPIWVTDSVKFHSDLGEGLRNSDIYSLHIPRSGKPVVMPDDFFHTGSPKYLALPEKGNWMRGFENQLNSDFEVFHQRSLNNTKFLPNKANGISYGFTFYGGNDQPKWTEEELTRLNKEGDPRVKDFEDLADRDKTGEKFTRLGVARLDLDNLSLMADNANASFALNATFSAQLDLFLSGYINTIWKNEQKEYKDFLNIVFSGGDDMLLVGRWDAVLDFIADFRADFRKFMGERDDLTMSAGMTLVTPKFPIAKAVYMAGKAEDKAKAFNLPDAKTGEKPLLELPEKNAVCLLGEVISWDEEYRFVQYFSKKLELWSNKENHESTGVSASLLYRFVEFRQMQIDKKPNWRWLSAWYFQQVERDNKKSQAIFYLMKIFLICGIWKAKDGGEIQTFKVHPDRTLLLMAMAVRTAEFQLRSKKKKS